MEKKTRPKVKNIIIKKMIYFILIIIIILRISTLVDSVKIDKSEETLLFLGNEKIAPFIYKENNKTKGLVVDIVKQLSKKIHRNIEVQSMDWEEAQDRVLSGKADALLQINPSPEREKIYDFSTNLLKSEFSIFTKAENININHIHDLYDKKVGVESSGYAYCLLGNDENINTVTVPDCITGFQMIDAGELDALVADRWIGEYELAKSKVSGIQVIEEPIEVKYSHIAVRKGDDKLLKLINKGLK